MNKDNELTEGHDMILWSQAHDEVLELIEETLDIQPDPKCSLLSRLEELEDRLDYVVGLASQAYVKLEYVFGKDRCR